MNTTDFVSKTGEKLETLDEQVADILFRAPKA